MTEAGLTDVGTDEAFWLSDDPEAVWLRSRNRDPNTPPPSPALARAHEELEDLLRSLPSGRVDDSWHDDVLGAAIHSQRRIAQRRWAGTVAAGVAVIGLVALLWPTQVAREPMLAVAIRHEGAIVRGGATGTAGVGETLVITARADAYCDLRVYVDGSLVANCPGDSNCRSSKTNNEHLLEMRLDLPGYYHAVLAVGAGIAPLDDRMDAFVSKAQRANAKVRFESITVR
jgi:hypothetical protein